MNIRALAVGATALAVMFTATACGDSETDATVATSTVTSEADVTTEAAHNDADVMFAQMMLPHHVQALEMSDLILADDGVPAEVRDLAEQIKAAQGPEIAQLEDWLGRWDVPVDTSAGHHDMPDSAGMAGMLSDDELQALADAEGTEAARMFLEQMIVHHEGAVVMAQTQIDEGRFPDAVAMAHVIVDTQQQEIDTMHRMLTEL
ncbi:DUF305 domain-containing protein [Rhodococcus yananensis]|uniref:DUF305 domain-containing protein n=1 Tax=Rhodococcus yananensis TaxID=2879464 RepID=UPI001CF80D87|nr:DUF305 domain-containing protein [Rhodococcus yananensis]